MNREFDRSARALRADPRTSGDEPADGVICDKELARSPHERG